MMYSPGSSNYSTGHHLITTSKCSEDQPRQISTNPQDASTPTKLYAGTKFHTTSPSPKSLPIPVFTTQKMSSSSLSQSSASSPLIATLSASSSHSTLNAYNLQAQKKRSSLTTCATQPAALRPKKSDQLEKLFLNVESSGLSVTHRPGARRKRSNTNEDKSKAPQLQGGHQKVHAVSEKMHRNRSPTKDSRPPDIQILRRKTTTSSDLASQLQAIPTMPEIFGDSLDALEKSSRTLFASPSKKIMPPTDHLNNSARSKREARPSSALTPTSPTGAEPVSIVQPKKNHSLSDPCLAISYDSSSSSNLDKLSSSLKQMLNIMESTRA